MSFISGALSGAAVGTAAVLAAGGHPEAGFYLAARSLRGALREAALEREPVQPRKPGVGTNLNKEA